MNEATSTIRIRGREHAVRAGVPVHKALKRLQITPGSHLIVRAGTLITDDEMLKPGDVIELLPVISGG